MKPFKFSFQSEPIWMFGFSLGLLVAGLLISFFLVVIRTLLP